MNRENINIAFLFIGLILLQVIVLNNINFLGYINPLYYIWFIFLYPIRKDDASVLVLSFLLGLITLSAATAYEGLQGGDQLIDTFGWTTPLIGLFVAFVSAMAAVKWMVTWLNEKGFEIFGWYRVAVGILAFVLLAVGAI